MLRDAGALVLGSQDSAPALRIVISHEALPAECEPDPRRPTPVVLMNVKAEDDGAGARRYRLVGFTINPWAAPSKRRAR